MPNSCAVKLIVPTRTSPLILSLARFPIWVRLFSLSHYDRVWVTVRYFRENFRCTSFSREDNYIKEQFITLNIQSVQYLFSYSLHFVYLCIFFHSHPVLLAFTSTSILGIQRKQWQEHSCKAQSCPQDRRSLYQGSSKNMVWTYIDENGALWLFNG